MSTRCTDQAVIPLEAESGALASTRAEAELVAGHWLSSVMLDVNKARAQWAEQGITALRCGGISAAARMPAEQVLVSPTEDLAEFTALPVLATRWVGDSAAQALTGHPAGTGR